MENITILKNVPYTNSGDRKHTLDLFLPKTKSDVPLMVYIHGGSWRTGDKDEPAYQKLGQTVPLFHPKTPVAVAVLNYRLSLLPEPSYHPMHVKDCAKAIWFLRQTGQNYGFGSSKIVLVGHSAGGQITGMLLLNSYLTELGGSALLKSIRGIIGVDGIYDVPDLLHEYPTYSDFIVQAFSSDSKLWESGSPISYSINEKSSEVLRNVARNIKYLVLHSLEDELLTTRQSERYFNHLKSFLPNVELDMKSVKGTHFGMLETSEFYERLVKFVEEL
ncbi:Alpha/Beta hydrolase protein [Paraphysoderma sedebokerense]|nr:Alpha/Beta hydrolase protein [Paraphysoderma sedebokerense]